MRFLELYRWIKSAFIYRINKNIDRDKYLWVFGCWGGMKYADNSKYLFEYIVKNYPQIRAVWITINSDIYDTLKNNNKEVYLANSFLADRILKKAGVAFFTNSLNDFGDNPMLNGAKICSLFHGVGFKKELRELDNQNTFKSKLKLLKHRIYDLSYTSLIFTTSDFLKKKFHRQQYNAPLERIILTGQPRNDVFFERGNKNRDEKLILYLPTFREDKIGKRELERIINEMVDSETLNTSLGEAGYRLIIKPHYLTKVHKNNNLSNIRLYDDSDIPDIQRLLMNIDILITDYSSVIGDFVLLNRPIIFFSYDLDKYKKLKPMDSEYDEVLNETYVTTLDELLSLLNKLFYNQVHYQSVNNIINNYINAPFLRNGEYCKNICDYMFTYLNINR